MMKQSLAIMRLIVIGVMVAALTAVAAAPATAQREPERLTRAQQVREMVLKQREKVLAQIDAIMAGEKDTVQAAQIEAPAEEDAAAEDSEPEGDEVEGGGAEIEESDEGETDEGEAEDGESEGSEVEEDGAEDEEVLELPDAGVGQARDPDVIGSALTAIVGALAAIGRGVRRRFS